MATVDVLVVVDVEGALASDDLGNNLYMVDTNKFLGSYQEGGPELVTTLNAGDRVTWSVSPIDPANNVAIDSFGGQAVGINIIPQLQPDASWTSIFSAAPPTPGSQYQYTMTLLFAKQKRLSFDPFLKIASS
jgi:hypothetical protein